MNKPQVDPSAFVFGDMNVPDDGKHVANGQPRTGAPRNTVAFFISICVFLLIAFVSQASAMGVGGKPSLHVFDYAGKLPVLTSEHKANLPPVTPPVTRKKGQKAGKTSCEPGGETLPTEIASSFDTGPGTAPKKAWLKVAQAAVDAGFHGDCLAYAVAVARAESGLRYGARQYNGKTAKSCPDPITLHDPACRVDIGWWQINTYWHPEVKVSCSDNLECAANWVYQYTDGGRNEWAAWCTTGSRRCTNDGSFSRDSVSQYVPQGRLAAKIVGGWK